MIPRGILVLGFVSMLMDISSEMIHSLLPVFMVSTLGASVLVVGLIEGFAEGLALIVKVFSGMLSDYIGKRKALAVVGYGLGALSKPIFAMALSVQWVLVARSLDRLGKGIRGAPRDALVADLTPTKVRGAAYGLRQSLDTIGAFLGPLLAIVLMILWSGNFQAVFWIAVIPAFLSVLLLVVGVREPRIDHRGSRRRFPLQPQMLRQLGRAYWWVVAAGAVFTLARFSEAFLILRAQQIGLPDALAPAVLVLMNIFYALSAYPAGRLADRIDCRYLLAGGLAVLIVSDLVLAGAQGLVGIGIAVALWGVHMGMTQGVMATMIANVSPAHLRGTAFGVFYLASGIAMLLASVLAGLFWDMLGSSATFYAGAIFSAVALAMFALSNRQVMAAPR